MGRNCHNNKKIVINNENIEKNNNDQIDDNIVIYQYNIENDNDDDNLDKPASIRFRLLTATGKREEKPVYTDYHQNYHDYYDNNHYD